MANGKFKSQSITVETIVNCIAGYKDGLSTPQIRGVLNVIDGYDLGNKIYSIAVNGHVEKIKSGNATSHNIYKITKEGKALLKRNAHKIQDVDDIIYYPMQEGDGRKANKPASQVQIIPPAPVYSPTAQDAMNLLSSIIDANEQARKALETVYMTVEGYFTANTLDELPQDAGPFASVIDEMQSFREILEQIKTITEPEQGNDVNEPSQESLID